MRSPERSASDPADLVRAAQAGDQQAWNALVDRFSTLVWSIILASGLRGEDAADTWQTVWLRLVEHITRLREPAYVGSWLAQTTRHQCIHVRVTSARQRPTGDIGERADSDDIIPEKIVIRTERDLQLWKAFTELRTPCQELLRILLSEPTPSYAEVASALRIKIGSIGPTRQRCLEQLRRRLAAQGVAVDQNGAVGVGGDQA
jgi:RNA polymerase sigma factor (sigma-70 family)